MSPTDFRHYPTKEELDRRKIVGINAETVTEYVKLMSFIPDVYSSRKY
jgi:hypothetical protein